MNSEWVPVCNLGIIITGGCAPGLNGIISAATEFAHRLHWRVVGFQQGYKYLMTGNPELVAQHMIEITDALATWKQTLGGSIIKLDRTDISKNQQAISNTYKMLKHFQIRYLLAIGGNDVIRCCHYMSQGVDPTQMQIIAIPKTISNDIQLPERQASFGYNTARAFGVKLLRNIIVDAQSFPRWFVVELMGRQTGHLALSISFASAADLCIIPEDFPDSTVSLSDLCDVIEGAILKKRAKGMDYGVVCICEGLIERLNDEDKQAVVDAQHISSSPQAVNYSESEISIAVAKELNSRLRKREIDTHVTPKKIGYELRGAKPYSYDSIYARELGVAAINGFMTGHSNCVVHWDNGYISYRSFRSLVDPTTGYIEPRVVDINSVEYKTSRIDMTYLTKSDFSNKEQLAKLAEAANSSVEQFLADFAHVPNIMKHL